MAAAGVAIAVAGPLVVAGIAYHRCCPQGALRRAPRRDCAGRRARLRGSGTNPLIALAWILLCLAAARPQQFGEAVQPPQVGRDLMLALDLSGSMSEPDMELGGRPVDRLTAAKAVLADFLDRRAGDRVGLLVFGRRAYALTPLTLDRDSVREQLDDSVVGLAGQETAIGDAIGLAVKRLRTQPAEQRVLIVLTDGVNTAGVLDPRKAAELARGEHVRVHAIAFGGEGSLSVFGFKLPLPGAGDEIDEATLRMVAKQTGGRFFRARDTAELAGIYAEIDRLEPIRRPGKGRATETGALCVAAVGGTRVRPACVCVAAEARMNYAALLQDLGSLHFLRPGWLGALLLLPVLAWWWKKRQRQQSAWRGLVDPHLLPHLLEARGDRRSRHGIWLAAAGYLLAVLALAGPSWRQSAQPLWQSRTPVVVALDLSSASLAADLPPSRLAQARAKLGHPAARTHRRADRARRLCRRGRLPWRR
jgi:Ca-activated chloride channel family protein